jgi:hypothetical protein
MMHLDTILFTTNSANITSYFGSAQTGSIEIENPAPVRAFPTNQPLSISLPD